MNTLNMATHTRLPRRTLFKGVGALGMGLALSQLDFLPSTGASVAAADTEQVQDILDILATNEAFGVTLVGTVLDSAKNGAYNPAIPAPVLKILTGVRAQEQFHLDFFLGAGAKLRTQTFHIPDPVILAKPTDLFMDLVELEDAAIAAVIASLRTFTREGRIDLLKANIQFATEESEHRLLANRALGTRPANDHAFAPALFTTVAEFYAALRQKGIIDGTSGKEITYPGAGAIDPTGVIYRTPGGPLVSGATPGAPGAPTALPMLPRTGGGFASGGSFFPRCLGDG